MHLKVIKYREKGQGTRLGGRKRGSTIEGMWNNEDRTQRRCLVFKLGKELSHREKNSKPLKKVENNASISRRME